MKISLLAILYVFMMDLHAQEMEGDEIPSELAGLEISIANSTNYRVISKYAGDFQSNEIERPGRGFAIGVAAQLYRKNNWKLKLGFEYSKYQINTIPMSWFDPADYPDSMGTVSYNTHFVGIPMIAKLNLGSGKTETTYNLGIHIDFFHQARNVAHFKIDESREVNYVEYITPQSYTYYTNLRISQGFEFQFPINSKTDLLLEPYANVQIPTRRYWTALSYAVGVRLGVLIKNTQ